MWLAIAASCAVVLSAPFMGQLRGALQSALPQGTYRTVIGAAVLLTVAAAACVCVARIRDRRLLRYGALALALAVGIGYARWSASGNANVDLVERVHFVEYGLLALLYFRVWRDRGDLSTLTGPALACTTTALGDEWLQWFVPGRVGEIRDVGLDAVAIGCGLLFAIALNPPARFVPRVTERPALGMAGLAAATVLTTACFIAVIHLGHEIRSGWSIWRSRFTAQELNGFSQARRDVWSKTGPPMVLERLSREDQYLAEGIWHVQRRNEAAGSGDSLAAWRENEILEAFFAPVLDFPSYAAPSPSRWPQEQRENIGAQVSLDDREYVSPAQPFPLFVWNLALFWAVVAVVFSGVCWWCMRPGRRGEPRLSRTV